MNHFVFATAVLSLLPSSALAEGPTGIGGLKIGMTREQVLALGLNEDVHIRGALTPFQYPKDVAPPQGRDKFDVPLMTPLAGTPMKATLAFESGTGRLVGIELLLDPSTNLLDKISQQISDKYGAGKIDDARKDEQCIYQNGANFKITFGTVTTKWLQTVTSGEQIQSSLVNIHHEFCPRNLREGRRAPIRVQGFSIELISDAKSTATKNVF